VLRAGGAVVLVGLLAWAAYARLIGDDPGTPAAAPLPPATSEPQARPPSPGPPPWVRYPSPLEWSWTTDSGRLTLVIANARLTLTDTTHYRSLRYIRIAGHRVHVQPSGQGYGELATYRWRIAGDRLTFRLLERTPKAALRLEELTFHRRA
jgi:hypothetical protein